MATQEVKKHSSFLFWMCLLLSALSVLFIGHHDKEPQRGSKNIHLDIANAQGIDLGSLSAEEKWNKITGEKIDE